MKVHLITIDPQNDFCIANGPGGNKGQLVVPGAEEDINRLAAFITKNGKRIDEIHCTLDSHQSAHIAHPIFWTNAKGENPPPFSVIAHDDTVNGVWFPSNPRLRAYGERYTGELKKHGRYQLMIWPPHCLIGTWGHSIVPAMAQALLAWEKEAWQRLTKVDFVAKGSNVLTEHYSGVQADVPDDGDPSTKLNTVLIDALRNADQILITGEALSHCVANTIRDIANNFGDDNVKKFVFLEDTSSNVANCEALGKAFVKEMVGRGMKVANTKDW
jgi:nicotinamidase/pyrazinamidase